MGKRRATAPVVAAGLIAAVLYAPLAAVLFQVDRSDAAIPTGRWNQLFWIELAAGRF